jgi:hypothetical protein
MSMPSMRPTIDAPAMRELLARSLAGLSQARFVAGLVPGTTPSTLGDPDRAIENEAEADDSLPADEPPMIKPPPVYHRPDIVEVSGRFIASLKRHYGRGVATDEGRRIGDIPEVADWLASLKPGEIRPRAQP